MRTCDLLFFKFMFDYKNRPQEILRIITKNHAADQEKGVTQKCQQGGSEFH